MSAHTDEALWAEGEPAHLAAQAIAALLTADRKRGKAACTVQWIPEPPGCRFEIIHVASGDIVGTAHIAADGSVTLNA